MNSEGESMADFERTVMGLAAATPPQSPRAFYNRYGDCIEFLISNESFYAERVDDLLTVYYGQESREIVGSLLKGVGRLFAEFAKSSPGFVIDVEDGRIRLSHLLTAGMWKHGDEIQGLK